jgi:molybdate transport system substrate-binding protein
LTDVFEQIGDAFVMANPDAEVTFNFGSSGQLSTQIVEGAPADVAAFADTAPMDALDDADVLAAPPEIFATNELVLVTPPGNPAGLRSLADLPGAGIVSLCVETAPCGKFAAQLLSVARVTLDEAAVSRGQDVRSTLTAVTEGDADAAIVYVTDAAAAGDAVEVVTVPRRPTSSRPIPSPRSGGRRT